MVLPLVSRIPYGAIAGQVQLTTCSVVEEGKVAGRNQKLPQAYLLGSYGTSKISDFADCNAKSGGPDRIHSRFLLRCLNLAHKCCLVNTVVSFSSRLWRVPASEIDDLSYGRLLYK